MRSYIPYLYIGPILAAGPDATFSVRSYSAISMPRTSMLDPNE